VSPGEVKGMFWKQKEKDKNVRNMINDKNEG